MQLKGAKLVHQFRANLVIGVPVQIASLHGLFITMLVVLALGLSHLNIWAVGILSAVVGLAAQLLGAFAYKLERKLHDVIAG